jgi:predicted DsbA family dithiol-disulfide isomerase
LRRRADQFGLDIVLVDIWEGAGAAEEAAAYCERWGIAGTVLLDETAAYARSLDIRGVPTNVFVDHDAVVRAVGATTSEDLFREAERLEPRLRSDPKMAGGDRPEPIGFTS